MSQGHACDHNPAHQLLQKCVYASARSGAFRRKARHGTGCRASITPPCPPCPALPASSAATAGAAALLDNRSVLSPSCCCCWAAGSGGPSEEVRDATKSGSEARTCTGQAGRLVGLLANVRRALC